MSRAERARVLFERHDIPFEYDSDTAAGQNDRDGRKRVYRSVRVRDKFICHVCGVRFGGRKACPQCSHRRCDACPWGVPPRRA
jgi:rubrerythrin